MATQNKIEKITAKQDQISKQENPQHHLLQSTNHQKPTTSHPHSPSSSPSHEFSFTISLHPSPPSVIDKRKTPPSIAIDLSPADDIFFHGHLLPLHLLSHFSNSPRISTTSLDNLNPTIRDLFSISKLNNDNDNDDDNNNSSSSNNSGSKGRSKPKSFSLFKFGKWRKAFQTGESKENKRKLRFNVRRVLKRYVRVVRPFLFFRGREKEKREQPYSFSGNLNSFKWKEWGVRRRGGFSAPASMRTSPTNSGLLLATTSISSSNDSTMEELQNAIQAAIAHCKNSIAVKEETCK
ncbi:BRI1 kinase inhibitor 1-like [Magnolia sinica]|uniref:BRI1 kinase inhibitor 1-like n=1 Tax=Magnolia sinica TaxID=86752 RepID=UPI00265987BC|nr:BRI1 kinase inhibitor 1-like [Magnolia sinica]